jgi:hypothetical protein
MEDEKPCQNPNDKDHHHNVGQAMEHSGDHHNYSASGQPGEAD